MPKHEPREQGQTARSGGEVWLWGLHPVRAALSNPDRTLRRIAATPQGLAALGPTPPGLQIERLDAAALARKLPQGAVHQGVALLAKSLPDFDIEDVCGGDDPNRLVVVLDQVTDPHNIGAVLRSAAAFGATALVLTERHAPQTTGVLAKAASGALDVVPMVRVVNLARALTELAGLGFTRIGLAEEGGATLAALNVSGPVALVLGAEGEGLRRLTRETCDHLARLPTRADFGSLNVSNAAAVALYELRRR